MFIEYYSMGYTFELQENAITMAVVLLACKVVLSGLLYLKAKSYAGKSTIH